MAHAHPASYICFSISFIDRSIDKPIVVSKEPQIVNAAKAQNRRPGPHAKAMRTVHVIE